MGWIDHGPIRSEAERQAWSGHNSNADPREAQARGDCGLCDGQGRLYGSGGGRKAEAACTSCGGTGRS